MTNNPNVKEIVEMWLRANNYDGLFCGDANCACQLDDLMPCDEFVIRCKAGYKTPCDGSCEDGDCMFHISSDFSYPEKAMDEEE